MAEPEEPADAVDHLLVEDAIVLPRNETGASGALVWTSARTAGIGSGLEVEQLGNEAACTCRSHRRHDKALGVLTLARATTLGRRQRVAGLRTRDQASS